MSSLPVTEPSTETASNSMALADRSPNTLKRRFDDMTAVQSTELPELSKDALLPVQNFEACASSGGSSGHQNVTPLNGLSRQASPAPSATSTSLTSISATPPPPTYGHDGADQPTAQASGQPPAKRRKLTPAEKEQRRTEKEQRDREKAETKAKKDEEKQAKAEETRLKKEAQEEKKRAKELEQSKKEEEKAKKERAQSRINAFFAKPQTPAKSGNGPGVVASDRSPLPAASADLAPNRSPPSTLRSDYVRTFLPFAVPPNTTVAPVPVHTWDEAATRHIESSIFESSSSESRIQDLGLRLHSGLDINLRPRTRRRDSLPTVKEIMRRLTGTQANPLDSTAPGPSQTPIALLQQIRVRYLEFAEDVRPAYLGTFSKILSDRLPRKPMLKERPDTDYEYDSEAEWEEPEEGEDLESEGESEGDSVEAGEDMEEFLDDEEAEGQASRRRATLFTDLEPISSGICFEDVKGDSFDSSGAELNFRSLRLELLLDNTTLPLDPFNDEYWPKEIQPTSHTATAVATSTIMPPPLPLAADSKPITAANKPINFLQGTKKAKTAPAASSASRLLEGNDLEAFKQAVKGSDFNKTVLLGLLKKQFPKHSKAVLTETLSTVAARQGVKESDKKWVLL